MSTFPLPTRPGQRWRRRTDPADSAALRHVRLGMSLCKLGFQRAHATLGSCEVLLGEPGQH